MCLPGKKDTKKVEGQVRQKYILNDYLDSLHVKFLAGNPSLQLSYITFTRIRPKEIIPVSYSSRKTCLCEKHQNFSLKLMPPKRVNMINTSNPDVVRKQFSDDDKLQDVSDKVNDDEIRFSQWKRLSVEKGGKLIKKMKPVDVMQSTIEYTEGFKFDFKLFNQHSARTKKPV